ncbi:DoxX family protein [Rhodococcus jostii]|uniref:DoxX family protein n=1 Tax=Rhodococcus jostii TaxID=132919 RepID=A0ABU4CTV1_RHOJO|nr:DoxX family protein [Rhodococcus jostii]MDV6286989.1 DoxX family protein [Rhodococcus jostii]
MDIGLLILRLIVGAILFVHGMQKARGWFDGPGLDGAVAMFGKIGQEPPRQKVRLAIACEVSAAALLVLGLATPLAAAIAAATMLVAGAALTTLTGKVWITSGGGEYPLVLGALAVVIGFTGPGAYSLDAISGLDSWTAGHSTVTGILVAAVALVGASQPIISTRRILARRGADTN